MAKKLTRILIILLGLLVLIQIVPYGRDRTNPPVQREPEWDSPQTRAVVQRACFDCHSNETEWPWYSYIAPSSWLVQRDVDRGREHLNFSEWGTRKDEDAEEIAEMVRKEEMPLPPYLLIHPEARLSNAEREELIAGIERTLAATGKVNPDAGDDDDHSENDDKGHE